MPRFLLILTVISAAGAAQADEPEASSFRRKTEWNGYGQVHFKVAGRAAYLVEPKQPAAGKPWIWRARFPDYHSEMDVVLLGQGYHIGYLDVAGMFGSPAAVKAGDAFYRYVTTEHGLSRRPCLEGVSRGGLFVYNWTATNADKVACIYCDTPVCDFKSWPGGRGQGIGSVAAWKQCLKSYGLSEPQALKYAQNPVDHAEVAAQAKIPILHIVSENDRVVPPQENSYLLRRRLQMAGHDLAVISVPKGTEKSNGHHFVHPEPDRVVKFIVRHTQASENPLVRTLARSKRIVFLGDSITYAGDYVAFFDAWLLMQRREEAPVIINVGLPSETVSGLSEDGHAGGRFPRPELAERLDRVLQTTRPDLVIACYGINCGIYQPLDEARLHSFQRGMSTLKSKVEAAGASLVVMTPPSYDDQRAKKSFSYNSVLDHYATWLLAQRKNGWQVIDLHGPMTDELAKRRENDAGFTFQPDAVHPNLEGHWFIAQQLIRSFAGATSLPAKTPQQMLAEHQFPDDALPLLKQRINVRRDAYLGAAGHKRPGVRAGLPIQDAEQRAAKITAQLLAAKPRPQ